MSKTFANSQYAVVGAGLIGRLLAVALAKRGAQVEIYEQGAADALQSPARIAAAMLAPLAESAITEDNVVRMGVHSLSRWPTLLSELSSPVFFQQNGTLILWHRQDASDAERFIKHLERNSANNEMLSNPEKVDGERLRSLDPSIGERFHQALYLPNEGQLDNRQLLSALATELDILKVRCHWNSPADPELLREQNKYDWVIDCRGLGAKAAWGQNAKNANSNPLRGIRGEVIRLHAPEVKLQRPTRLIHPRYPIYIAPKENDVYVVGATEIESEDLSEMSLRSAMELLSAIYTVHSGFAEARILEMATQCRPTLKDNLPEIRISQPGLMLINGLYRHGFMISPAILDCALEILEHGVSTTASTLNLRVTKSTALSSAKGDPLCA
jgi:glycine oxidase